MLMKRLPQNRNINTFSVSLYSNSAQKSFVNHLRPSKLVRFLKNKIAFLVKKAAMCQTYNKIQLVELLWSDALGVEKIAEIWEHPVLIKFDQHDGFMWNWNFLWVDNLGSIFCLVKIIHEESVNEN